MVFRFVAKGSTFVRSLALGSIEMMGVVRSAPLPPVETNVSSIGSDNRPFVKNLSMSAGKTSFQHFNRLVVMAIKQKICFYFRSAAGVETWQKTNQH